MLKLYYGDAVKPAPSHSVRLEGKVYMSTVNGQLRYVLYAPTDTILYDIRDTFRELWEGPDCNTLFNRLDLCIRARTIKRPELKHIYLYGDMLVLRADFGRFENKDVVQVDVFDTLKALGQHLVLLRALRSLGYVSFPSPSRFPPWNCRLCWIKDWTAGTQRPSSRRMKKILNCTGFSWRRSINSRKLLLRGRKRHRKKQARCLSAGKERSKMYDEVTLHVCPNHCGAHFDVTVHVTQDWEVDAEGNFEKALNEAGEVTHGPQEDDCWVCSKCGAEAEAIQCVIMEHDIEVPESDGAAHTRLRTYVQRRVPLMDLPRAFIKYPETGGVYEATVVQNQNGSYTAKYGKYEFSF